MTPKMLDAEWDGHEHNEHKLNKLAVSDKQMQQRGLTRRIKALQTMQHLCQPMLSSHYQRSPYKNNIP